MYDIKEIQSIIPHRYPFLLVDRIESLDSGKKVLDIKHVTINEEFFQGHFPGEPIMPGVLIIESMAQIGGFLMLHSIEDPQKVLPFFASIDKARFRSPVVPGDTLKIEAEMIKMKGKVAKIRAKGFVKDNMVSEAELMFIMQDK